MASLVHIPAMKEQRFFSPTSEQANQRLDRYLASAMPDFSRSRIQTLIENGHVQVEGHVMKSASLRIKEGETIRIDVPEPESLDVKAVKMDIAVVFEDAHLLVIDKPAGLTVHPAPGHSDDTLVNALLAHCGASLSGIGGVMRPGIVHRLDKDTSGLMVVAKHDEAHQALSAQLVSREMKRQYVACVWGAFIPPYGTITGAIGRSEKNRKKMTIVKKGGKEARTHYKTIEQFYYKELAIASLVQCDLDTGRTHQIRVHMAHNGHAVVGDPLYGSTPPKARMPLDLAREFPRQALHARSLSFIHPKTGQPVEFSSNIPDDMNLLLSGFRGLQS